MVAMCDTCVHVRYSVGARGHVASGVQTSIFCVIRVDALVFCMHMRTSMAVAHVRLCSRRRNHGTETADLSTSNATAASMS